jgi:hypothetical protein
LGLRLVEAVSLSKREPRKGKFNIDRVKQEVSTKGSYYDFDTTDRPLAGYGKEDLFGLPLDYRTLQSAFILAKILLVFVSSLRYPSVSDVVRKAAPVSFNPICSVVAVGNKVLWSREPDLLD